MEVFERLDLLGGAIDLDLAITGRMGSGGVLRVSGNHALAVGAFRLRGALVRARVAARVAPVVVAVVVELVVDSGCDTDIAIVHVVVEELLGERVGGEEMVCGSSLQRLLEE